MNDAAPDDAGVAQIERLFERWIGFDVHGAAPRRIKDFLAIRASQIGFDRVRDYLDALPRERPTTEEAQRLVNVLTNGLTAFWRDPTQIEALASLLGQLHARYGRTLDVWCAGCATGEEAYSVAMAALELGVPIRVLGTDVNTGFLDSARRAEFDDWSLRRLDAERRDRWFTRVGNRWGLHDDLTARVDFRHHNLLDAPPVPPAGAWDAIVCRNVIIYLTPDAVRRILVGFAASIARDGYLVLGSSEQIGQASPLFRAVQKGPAFVYRPLSIEPGESFPFAASAWPPPRAATLDEETTDALDDDAVRRLLRSASLHEHDAAIACYEAAAGYDPFAPEIYALLGLAMLGAGADERALSAFAKVLFLDPENWWAAARRAEVLERLGDRAESQRYYRQAVDAIDHRTSPLFDARVAGLRGLDGMADAERQRALDAIERLAAPTKA